MPTVKYFNPNTSTWDEISTAGAQGPPGPSGPTGATGATGTFAVSTETGNIVRPGVPDGLVYVPDQVIIGGATPAETSPLWVDEATAAPTIEFALDELTDVDVTTTAPADGDTLVYNAVASQWVPGASGGVPLGSIISYASATPPPNWLLCDGSAIPASYTELIALVGATTPDLRNKFVAGAGDAYVAGDTGGLDEVTLDVTQMPSHTHVVIQTGSQGMNASTYGDYQDGPGIKGYRAVPPGENAAVGGPLTATATGNGLAHENRPPFYALTYIIKSV